MVQTLQKNSHSFDGIYHPSSMPEFRMTPSARLEKVVDGAKTIVWKQSEVDRFNPSILGLGDLSSRSKRVEALAAVFDLEGFTNFCKQIDPHLSVPAYLNAFLNWLMAELKKETVQEKHPEGSELWHPLPFFVKFLGDGLLILWDCETMSQTSIQNLIISLCQICRNYRTSLLKSLRVLVVDPPPILRCGLARGTVYSVGDSADYVGSCINMAARLQKLPGVVFVFNQRGVETQSEKAASFFREKILVRKVAIRGIGENELICILKEDHETMTKDELNFYRAP